MLSNWDMMDIVMIEDRQEREAALGALSNEDARAMLKSLVRTFRRSHDEAAEAGML